MSRPELIVSPEQYQELQALVPTGPRPSGRGGGLTGALRAIRADEGLSIRKAKRRFLFHVWRLTSPGLRMLERKRRGLSWVP